MFGFWCFPSPGATITGTLTDLSLQPLNTKLIFTPTNDVLLTAAGLSAGPAKIIDTTNGAFALALDAGDYTVSLPLIPWRRPFAISVMDTSATVNITNLLNPPRTYTYTNNLSYGLALVQTNNLNDLASAADARANLGAAAATNALVWSSLVVDASLSNYDWVAVSNGVVCVPAWNNGHGMARDPGLYFFNTNGAVMGSIESWANHGGPSAPETLIISMRNLALMPGNDGQYVSGLNGEIQIGVSAAIHDSSHIQYDDDPFTAGWADGLGSQPFNVGHSKRLQFRARDTNGSFAKPAIMGFTAGNTNLVSGYGDIPGSLRFFTMSPEWQGGSTGFSNSPGVLGGEMTPSGWNLRGSLVQEKSSLASGAAAVLDFQRAVAQVLDVSTASLTITTSNLPSASGNFQAARLFIRSGPYAPTLTFPSWRWGNEAGSATAPASLAAEKMLEISLRAIGSDDTNVLASYTIHPWPFAYDSDAQDFFSRAAITDATQKLAVNQLVTDAKAHGWWTNCDVIYPFVGGTASTHSYNLKSASYRITWSGTLTHDANGVSGNGTTGYGNTGYNFKSNGAAYATNSCHLFAYGGSTAPTDGGVFLGGYRYTGTASRAHLKRSGANLEISGSNDNDGSGGSLAAGTDFRGPLMLSRTSATAQLIGARAATGNGNAATAVEPPNTACAILCRIDQDGATDNFSNANLRGATLGGGFTLTQWNTFRADWDNFENTLSRKAP